MVKNSKLQKRQAPRNENEQKELPTKEKVAKSFESDLQEKKKKENQDEKAEANKRPLSDSSISPPNQPQRRKNLATEEEFRSLFDLDPEISSDSRTGFDEIKPFANSCCHELIQKCTGRHFASACVHKNILNVSAAGKKSPRRRGISMRTMQGHCSKLRELRQFSD